MRRIKNIACLPGNKTYAADKRPTALSQMTANKKSKTHIFIFIFSRRYHLEFLPIHLCQSKIKREMRGYTTMNASAMVLLTLVLCLVKISAASKPVVLASDNFETVTAGKTVFIKFYMPWCSHCQDLAPNWEKFAAKWVDHPQLLVAEVDCTKDEKWCQTVMNIEGFPTLLFGDPSQSGVYLQRYNGDKASEDLSAFANETLTKPFCSPGNVDACDSKLKKEIKGYLKMSKSKLEKEIQKKENAMDDAEDRYKIEFEMMQAKYDKLTATFESISPKLKANLKMLQAVKEATKWRSQSN
jgi:protein disulfide-isomerase-like protein